MTEAFRHRRVPERAFGEKLIVARPEDGAPVVLAATATLVWRQLDDWITPLQIDRYLGASFPDVVQEERKNARVRILDALQDDDLVERR